MLARSRALALATAMRVAAYTPESEPAAEKKGDDPAKLNGTIEAANASFMAARAKGGTAGATANYAEDAIVMMPSAPAWRGAANITMARAGTVASGPAVGQWPRRMSGVAPAVAAAYGASYVVLTRTPKPTAWTNSFANCKPRSPTATPSSASSAAVAWRASSSRKNARSAAGS